ncbi:MAG: SpoVG family protein [Candidatus Aadella gelida]|nr:SpoVG family protein [Candidatus Aadella gelida]
MLKKSDIKIERLHPLKESGPLKAFCDLLILNSFVIKGLRIVQGKEGLFLGMPQEQSRDGKWYDTFFPVSPDTRKMLQEYVISEYDTFKNNIQIS